MIETLVQCVAVCCSELQCVAVSCSVLQRVVVSGSAIESVRPNCSMRNQLKNKH